MPQVPVVLDKYSDIVGSVVREKGATTFSYFKRHFGIRESYQVPYNLYMAYRARVGYTAISIAIFWPPSPKFEFNTDDKKMEMILDVIRELYESAKLFNGMRVIGLTLIRGVIRKYALNTRYIAHLLDFLKSITLSPNEFVFEVPETDIVDAYRRWLITNARYIPSEFVRIVWQ